MLNCLARVIQGTKKLDGDDAESTQEHGMKWEYKTVTCAKSTFWGLSVSSEMLTAQLNKLGHDGWELVDSMQVTRWSGTGLMLILKRPRH